MDYGDFVIDSGLSSKIDKLERLQERIILLIEYYPVEKIRKDINVLYVDYNIVPLKTRRKKKS